jgi:hypothetical protein
MSAYESDLGTNFEFGGARPAPVSRRSSKIKFALRAALWLSIFIFGAVIGFRAYYGVATHNGWSLLYAILAVVGAVLVIGRTVLELTDNKDNAARRVAGWLGVTGDSKDDPLLGNSDADEWL